MSVFRDYLAADVGAAFLNPDEFAEARTVVYDGVTYAGILVQLQDLTEAEQAALGNAEGLYRVSAVLYVRPDDVGGRLPERGQTIKVNSGTAAGAVFYQEFHIVRSEDQVGLYRVELGAVDE